MTAAERPSVFHNIYGVARILFLDHESLNLVLQAPDLVHKITCFVRGNRCGNNSA